MHKKILLIAICTFVFNLTACANNTSTQSEPIATNTPAATSSPVATNAPVATNTPKATNAPDSSNTQQQVDTLAQITDDFTPVKGTWRLDGDEAAAFFVIDETGLVEAYYASGSLEYYAYLKPSSKSSSDYAVFELYNGEDKLINELWFRASNEFYLGEIDGERDWIFIKD